MMNSQLRSANSSAGNNYQYYDGFPMAGLSQLEGYSSRQASFQRGSSSRSDRLYYQPVQEVDENYYSSSNFPILDHTLCSDNGSQLNKIPGDSLQEQNWTLESSSATGSYNVYNSPSNVSFSSNGSPVSQQESHSYPSDSRHSPENNYGSPISGSCITEDVNDLTHKLRELETVMFGPDLDIGDSSDSNFGGVTQDPHPERGKQIVEMINRGDLKEVLIACARAVSEHELLTAEWLIAELRKMVSVSGEPIQRLGAYMLEGIVARLAQSGSCIYKALKCREPASAELLSYMHLLYEVCPYFKFGYLSANGAIAEALKDENRIHIIDFQIAQGSQWITLIQALAGRPSGPPQIRITGIDDSQSAHARGGGLQIVGQRLSTLAESCNIPFHFHAAAISGCDVEYENLGLHPGEAIAVNFPYMLHHMPDESVGTENHRDRLLRLVKGLSPKVVTLVEQESNTNTAPFFPRFLETLSYYTAMFESIDVKLPRDHKERINVEQQCVARDVVNIIACEGAERVERHELHGKWRSRLTMAGFSPYPLNSCMNAAIKSLLEHYNENYRLEEKDGVLFLGWRDRVMVSSSAWK